MDSFYDLPRRGPDNVYSRPLVQQATVLDVPEVSMISSSSLINSPKYTKVNDNHLSYNAWKYRNKVNINQESIHSAENTSILNKKQVRFQPPNIKRAKSIQNVHQDNEEPKAPIKTLCTERPFEQIYMANIPKCSKPKASSEIDKLKYITSSDDSLRRKNHYIDQHYSAVHRNHPNTDENVLLKNLQPEIADNLSKYQEIQRENKDEPSVSDLMKIIQQQNQQLTKLQSQIEELMTENRKKNEMKTPQKVLEENKLLENVLKPNRLPKYSFDVMTSFEVSIRAQKNFPQRLGKENNIFPSKLAKDNTVKIQEITEDCRLQSPFDSISLNQPFCVQERPVSPVRSVHVDMQDYSSDEEDSGSSIGASFYDNVLGQVNNILQQKQMESPTGTLKQVQAATFKHLQSLGVNVPIEEVDEADFNYSNSNSNKEISFAVKQILMKYLPDDLLTKVVTKEVVDFKPRKPEFSFATVQYLKKYNLLTEVCGNSNNGSPKKHAVKSNNMMQSTKILDITALKQQPKLL